MSDIKLFRKEIKFVAGAMNIKQIPNFHLSQIAFVGKSNVGKSSLINAICNRKDLARVSKTPGRTQQINFFNLSDHFLLVDLPGYGYAKVSAKEQQNWGKLITHYLFNTDKLKLINILIDSRRGIKQHDIDVMDMIAENRIPIQIVCTKSDEIKNHDEVKSEIKDFCQTRYKVQVEPIFTSIKKKEGLVELQKSMLATL